MTNLSVLTTGSGSPSGDCGYRSNHLRHTREDGERFKLFRYEELSRRDKLNLDIFWLKDDGHIDPDSLPTPEVVAAEIVENLEAALERFQKVAAELAAEGE